MTTPTERRLGNLAKRLLTLTREHKIDWEPTDERGSFLLVRGGQAVRLSRSSGDTYSLAISDVTGKEVERIEGSEPFMGLSIPVVKGDADFAPDLMALWLVVREQIDRPTSVIEDFEQDLPD